jgi:hypothetical protein
MKFLITAESASEFASIASLMESNGIPIHINSISARLRNNHHIYVFYDAQYEDAAALLSDPLHVVENQINMREFNALRDKLELNTILKGALIVLALVIVFAIFVFYVAYTTRNVA